jgi:hypothetical protein
VAQGALYDCGCLSEPHSRIGDEMTDYSEMTVNERLSEADIQGVWDRAVKNEDREKMTELMKLVGLEAQASVIIEAAIERWRYNIPKEIRYQEKMKRQNEAHPK